ncbi:hypothetical protein [Neorhizobium sp. IRS_2294]|uniref:hypothetical protein n=1 Tax=unclassified Neorhizobium TaxID=2629175 RepID=UPI003D293778
MRAIAIIIATVVSIYAGSSAAAPVEMTVDRLISICMASDIEDVSATGDELGWQRMSEADTSEWRSAFQGYNGGSVEVVGWKREQSDSTDSLSFWIAVGPSGHQACTYSTDHPAGLLDALKARLGSPDDFEKMEEIESTTAFWNKEGIEYAFSQTGSSAMIQISKGR